jgi:D-alanyl-D-alanine carboxypeptidase
MTVRHGFGRAVGLALGAMLATIATAQPLSSRQVAAIDLAARAALARTDVPAASIAIVQDGRIVYAHAYGSDRPGRPARTDARYQIASVSKQFTAAAILMLADQGKL